jgi:hypothetical protein
MARSYYKGPRLGKTPPCAICEGPGSGPRAALYLPHGVRVFLCPAHRHPEFLTARSGRDLVVSLMHVWAGSGCLNQRRHAALDAQLRRVQAAGRAPRRPGSYAWPSLRREAEARFAGGERPAAVFAELRARHGGGTALVPSLRTMQRWFAEGRWLAPPAPGPTAPRPGGGPPGKSPGSGPQPTSAPERPLGRAGRAPRPG